MNDVQHIDPPEETRTPRELLLERGAGILRAGAIANVVVVVVVLVAAIVAGLQLVPDLFPGLQSLLLGRVALDADTAVAVVILFILVDISLMLVLMVGVLARELWVLGAIWIVVGANALALVLLGFTPALLTIVIVGWAGVTVTRDVPAFRLNPVMIKELRGRMRGMRAFIVLTVYLGLMATFTTLLYVIYTASTIEATGSAAIGTIGRVLFLGLVGIELLLIIFIAPAFTAGAITGERERQTFDLLRATLLASPSFVIGKLESALGYILLLMFSAIPLQSIAFLFGGVTEVELVLAFIILTVTAITLGTVGIFFSATTPRTLSASLRSYTIALAVTFGIPILLSFPLLNAFNRAITGFGSGINTSTVIESLFIYAGLVLVSLNPIAAAQVSQQLLTEQQVLGFSTLTLSSDGSTIPIVSPWISFTVFYLVISTVLVVLAVRQMRRLEVE